MYDILFLGAGPGGYVGAIKAALNGLKCAIVEKGKNYGGTCVSVGCIPTKVLLHSANLYENSKKFKAIGIDFDGVSLNLENLMKQKDRIVSGMQKGVKFLLKNKGVDIYEGFGRIINQNEVEISGEGGVKRVNAKNVVISTGSISKDLPHIKFDGRYFVSSDEMLNVESIPEKIGIIGAGAVGVEFASIYRSFGSDVTIIELLPHLLPLFDEEISLEVEKIFKRRRIKFYTSSKVIEGKVLDERAHLKIETGDGKLIEESFDVVLIATGRKPNIKDIGIEEVGIELERGFIKVDEKCRTSVKNIFAIGDVINTPQLAHVASAEGIFVSNFVSGKNPEPINYQATPSAVYSIPPVSSVGFTEMELKEKGISCDVAKFPFMANGKAKIEGKGDGFVKFLTEKKSGKILGMHMVGGDAPEHIFLGALGINSGLSIFNISKTIFPHPTISEAIMEAAHILDGGGIHI